MDRTNLISYHVPGMILGYKDRTLNKTNSLPSWSFHSGEADNKQCHVMLGMHRRNEKEESNTTYWWWSDGIKMERHFKRTSRCNIARSLRAPHSPASLQYFALWIMLGACLLINYAYFYAFLHNGRDPPICLFCSLLNFPHIAQGQEHSRHVFNKY